MMSLISCCHDIRLCFSFFSGTQYVLQGLRNTLEVVLTKLAHYKGNKTSWLRRMAVISCENSFVKLLHADSHRLCCHMAACCRTGTELAVPHSTSLRSEAQGSCTPCRSTPRHLHMFWSNAATVPMSSSHHPQPPAVKQKEVGKKERPE